MIGWQVRRTVVAKYAAAGYFGSGMSRAFFDRWFPGELLNLDGFHAELAQVLPAWGRILDLGCGPNVYLERLRWTGHEVWGADLHRHPQLAHSEWFRLMPADGSIPFADASFDVVTAFMVVEHIADPRRFLQEVTRVLKPGGHFVAHTISAWHYVTWIRRAFDLLPHSWTQWLMHRLYGREEHDTFPTWYRMNTPRRIARAGEPLGLQLTAVRRYAWPGYFEFSPLLCRAAVMVDWLLERVGAGMGRIYFTATYRKAPEPTATATAA